MLRLLHLGIGCMQPWTISTNRIRKRRIGCKLHGGLSGLCGLVLNYQTLPRCIKAFCLRDLTHIDLRVCFLQLLHSLGSEFNKFNMHCRERLLPFHIWFSSANVKRNGILRRNHRSNHSATQAFHWYNNRWAGQASVKMTTKPPAARDSIGSLHARFIADAMMQRACWEGHDKAIVGGHSIVWHFLHQTAIWFQLWSFLVVDNDLSASADL